MPRLTKRELRAARKLGALMPKLRASDIVIAILPDGERLLVKGRDRLDCIIATGTKQESLMTYVPVLSLEAAVAVERELGGDGSHTQRGPVGHA